MKKVVVGISGGIDSAITAYLLKQEGYSVIGAHLKITDDLLLPKKQLERIGALLNIPISIIDGKKEFEDIVIKAFKKDHLAARTPSPCAICNPLLKWQLLFNKANEESAGYVASGHYIQRELVNGIWYLKKGQDELKDQSYYLWGLKQEMLKRIITPLGTNSKTDVKKLASTIGLKFLSKQKESVGLCFAQGLSYPELIQKHIPEAANINSGNVLDKNGEIIGKHKGYIYYTIGQKRGIEYFNNAPKEYCVVSINSNDNTLTVASNRSLWRRSFTINACNFTNEELALRSNSLEIKVRGLGWNPKGNAQIKKIGNTKYKVFLDEPAWAMAPGQPVVIYENNYLLGGGLMLE